MIRIYVLDFKDLRILNVCIDFKNFRIDPLKKGIVVKKENV